MWRGTVAATDPVRVNIPGITGVDQSVPCETIGGVTALTVGERVWMSKITGSTSWLCMGRRL